MTKRHSAWRVRLAASPALGSLVALFAYAAAVTIGAQTRQEEIGSLGQLFSGFFTKYTPDPENTNTVGGAGMGALVFQLLD